MRKSRNKKKTQDRINLSDAEFYRGLEKKYGMKFINPTSLIIEYRNVVWRPALGEEELQAAQREYVPILTINDEMYFLPLTWSTVKVY